MENQVAFFETYIQKNINWTFIGGYVDEGISGTTSSRRENFIKMIEDGKQKKFDLLITKENVEELKPINIRLNKYFDMALKHYPVLADSLIGYLSDKNELNTYFKHNFSFKEDYRNLEILPLDEELKYKVTALQD